MTFRLDGDRKPGFTLSGDTTYFLNTRAALRAVYYFNRILGVETGGGVARLTFPGSSTPRRDKTDSYHVGLRFRLAENDSGRRTEFSLRIQHYRRESTDPNQNRTRTTIGFGAEVGF